jgi:hypothetical protein
MPREVVGFELSLGVYSPLSFAAMPGLGALVPAKRRSFRRFDLDELLKYRADRPADQINRFTGT